MKTPRFNIVRFAAVLISAVVIGYLLIIGQTILAPLIFAALLAFLLKPITAIVEHWLGSRMWGIILTISGVILTTLSVIYVFGFQLGQIIGDFDNIKEKLDQGLGKGFRWLGGVLGMRASEVETWVTDNAASWADAPAQWVSTGLGSSMFVAGSFLLTLLLTFFFLLYRTSFYNFILFQFSEESRKQGGVIIRRIEQVTKEYLNGLLLVILILATLNSLGLFIIGVKLALFWGVLGALLAIVPYVGTILGGLLPFSYALASFGMSWQPLAVLIFYGVVQSLEGNIITPKVVGKSVRINPLIAILALLVGGAIWGIAGMVLALPLIAITKIIFANIEVLQPVSELFRDDLYEREHIFEEQYDEERYRLASYFQRLGEKNKTAKRTSASTEQLQK